jgi:uncharacterized paraquat-inducible protein A
LAAHIIFDSHQSSQVAEWLGILGKWSFLDLCIVLCVIESVSFSNAIGWAQATALEGAFVFSLGIVLSQVNIVAL